MFNLSKYHKIFPEPRDRHPRIMLEIVAGGNQEGNGRELLEFDSVEDRDYALDLIAAAFDQQAPIIDISDSLDLLHEAEDQDPDPTDREMKV